MSKQGEKSQKKIKNKSSFSVISNVFKNGDLLETVYRSTLGRVMFAVYQNGEWRYEKKYKTNTGQHFTPYSSNNNLIKNHVILFPSGAEEYESEESLIAEIQAYIHKYVDVSPHFEKLACCYVLFSWLYDGFNELPYLRLKGDYGTGKSRFLLTVGSLCYKPIFASGASTISPLFYILDSFRGTLIIDEGDFRFSDEKTDIVKILNNGNVKGIPLLRSERLSNKEFSPRAFHVYCPKIVATRGDYQDYALESRFITEEMHHKKLRKDIPINLPLEYKEEARRLRNKLLMFRFRNYGKKTLDKSLVDPTLEPRINQIFVPLMSVVSDEELRSEIHEVAKECNQKLKSNRVLSLEGKVLSVMRDLLNEKRKDKLSIKEITEQFSKRYQKDMHYDVTPKLIGSIIRNKLSLTTRKSNGLFVIPHSELIKLNRLYKQHNIESS